MGKEKIKDQRVGNRKLDRLQSVSIKGLFLSMIQLSKEERANLYEVIEKAGDLMSLELIKTALMVIDYYDELLNKIHSSVSGFDAFIAEKGDEAWNEYLATLKGNE